MSRSLTAVLGVALLSVAGCPRTEAARNEPKPAPIRPAFDPPPSTAAGVAPPASAAPAPRLAAWSDAPAIDALTADCAWTPPAGGDGEPSPLACASQLYAQSCSADPCYEDDQRDCKPRCEHACDACASGCTRACGACKTPCAAGDDACRRACATKCASCKQACLVAKDRCATGTCGKLYASCHAKLKADWDGSHGACAKACDKFWDCRFDCDDDDACRARCMKAFKAVCPARLAEMCAFDHKGPNDED